MQYISLEATTIKPGAQGTHLDLGVGFNPGVEGVPPAGVLRARFYHNMQAHDGRFKITCIEPFEECLPDDANETRLTGWLLAMSWTVAAAASWGLVIGCVAVVRAILP